MKFFEFQSNQHVQKKRGLEKANCWKLYRIGAEPILWRLILLSQKTQLVQQIESIYFPLSKKVSAQIYLIIYHS